MPSNTHPNPGEPIHSRFSIIIPVSNKWELTRNCLHSIALHTSEYDYEVIVVDNASSDATATELPVLGASLFAQRFRLLRQEENRNFGPACNLGAQAACSDLLFFLNNDTLTTPGWSPPLVEIIEGPSAPGAAGPLLLYEDDTVQHLGVSLTPSGFTHLYQGFPANHPVIFKKRPLQAITAAAILLPKALFLECGSFYPGYRNGFEDLELSQRITSAGKKLACVPSSVIYHLESQTPGRKGSEVHNARLLRERCEANFYVDLHHHAARDGFHVFVDDLMGLSLRLEQADEEGLTRQVEGKDPSHWLKTLRENPLWVAGKEFLAGFLEKQGAFREALQFRAELADQLSTVSSLKTLALSALKAKDSGTALQAEERLGQARAFATDPDKARRQAAYVLNHTAGRPDRFLEKLYQEKLSSWS